jgi:hypothetical protein
VKLRLLIHVLLLTLLAVAAAPAVAQNEEQGSTLAYGGRVSGQINNSSPRALYYFDGLRGEVLSLSLSATSGSLDPVLAVLDANGRLVASVDDSKGSRDVKIEAFRVSQSGRYYIVVGRFGFNLGSTSGGYELDVERIGVSSDSGSALRYGDSVINNITNMTPQVYYSFRANEGDIINISMARDAGDLDAYLQVVDSNAFVIADNDDVPGSNSLDARISNLVIQKTGTYIIVATRYGEAAGTSTGRFILTLEEAQNSGIGNSSLTAMDIQSGTPIEDQLDDTTPAKYYRFTAKQNDLVSVKLSRLNGSLDSFLVLTNAGGQEIASDDDSGGGQNAALQNFVIPADGTYYIIATRADREQGKTVGRFKLEFQALGNAFDGVQPGVQRITYGTTITGRIDDTTPEVLYAFRGEAGDIVTLSMNRGDGDLDAQLSLLNSDQKQLVLDDDSGGGQNARIARYVLPKAGIYYVKAARFSGKDGNPNTRGSFILVLAKLVK